jgi:hypothetical protein
MATCLAGFRPCRETKHCPPSLQAATRSDREFNEPPADDDDGNRQPDEWEDCDAWPPDDLDVELDDEPEPEPGDFWLPDDDEE